MNLSIYKNHLGYAFFIFLFLISLRSHSEILNLKANYFIPVKNESDLNFNSFSLENYEVELFDDGQAQMRFELPQDVTGEIGYFYVLDLKKKSSPTTKLLVGQKAKALCDGPWTQMKCTIQFDPFKINSSNLKTILNEQLSPSDALTKFKILSEFSSDPIGLAEIISN